ncbi:hypothetical protein I6N91_05095 [Arthrobacter sp. MSA 4-2]|uniref:hypothetical protein n=1 Tax=Arthrobacter sp. MSA 4-2 TaxID=2794349 RepID=UPI0018E70F1D|nr:hypothetical protein [Arthrobacter sp. MSA 4-2]MBJ2120353.1 hypothetical protein [Arthrobacter sp. MSA 4-2]
MRRINALATMALATTLSLVGCSSDSTSDDAPTSVGSTVPSATAENTPETYELGRSFTATTSYGATLTLEIPKAGPPEIEQLRTDLKIDPVSYAKVGIDNRQGTEDVSVYLVTVYDEDGTAYEFQDLSVYHIADWGPDYTDALGGVEGQYGYTLADGTVLDENVGDDLSRMSTELHNQYLNGTNASKLEVSTGWLASSTTELPDRITGITIQPYGLSEEVAMAPGGTMPSVKATPVPTAGPTVPSAQPTTPPSEPTPAEDPTTDTSSAEKFTYEEALAALNNGMPYYEAFCLRYEPTTDGGRSQCKGIEAGTVDPVTGEYLGG